MKVKAKTGHRESAEQHERSDAENQSRRMTPHRKADQHSGGGGRLGGGGKRSRPDSRWEKGDVARDEDADSSVLPLRARPGKRRRIGRR